MRWRLGLIVVGGVLAGLVFGALGTRAGNRAAKALTTSSAKLDPLPAAVTISLPAKATGRRVPDGFLGFSFEFQAVRAYTGSDPGAINPVFEQLIRNLSPGQEPVLRIGGDSTDLSYAPSPGVTPPPYVAYKLTPSWMATTAALAHALGARMTMGLNLVANDPALAAAEARDYVQAFGPGAIEALEIGNEPNLYTHLTVDHTLLGIPIRARPRSFEYPAFRRQYNAVVQAAPHLELAGPALAVSPTPQRGSWVHSIPDFLRRNPRVRTMTIQRYPLRNCYVPPSSPQYNPTVSHLRSPYSTVGPGSQPPPLAADRPSAAPAAARRRAELRRLPRQGGGQRHVCQRAVGPRRAVLAAPRGRRRRQHPHPATGRLSAVRVQRRRRPLERLGASRLLRPAGCC